MGEILDYILGKTIGHICYMCHKIIQEGNSAGIMDNKGWICIDCIIKPESGWGNCRTREEYFECMHKPETREEFEKQQIKAMERFERYKKEKGLKNTKKNI